jgi:hypothetical protein
MNITLVKVSKASSGRHSGSGQMSLFNSKFKITTHYTTLVFSSLSIVNPHLRIPAQIICLLSCALPSGHKYG